MAEYQLTANEHTVIRTADGAYVPDDPLNVDYQEYLKWVEGGGVPDPYVPLPPPPPPPERTVLFEHENRIRALEGQPPLSLDEFKAYFV